MNIEMKTASFRQFSGSIIKAPDVRMGPVVSIGIPIIQQAEAVAEAVWNKVKVPDVFQSALAGVNLDPTVKPSAPKFDILREANQVAEAAWNKPLTETVILSKEPDVAQLPRYTLANKSAATFFEYSKPVIRVIEPAAQQLENTNQKAQEARVSFAAIAQLAPATLSSPAQESKTTVKEFEQIEQDRMVDVEDWQAANQRRFEISTAIKKAWVVAKRVVGWMVFKLLPGQHEGNTSQLVKKQGPDGSFVDTVWAIKTDSREFKSEEETRKGLLPYVSIFKPAKKAKQGKKLGRYEVARVVRYLIVKPIQAYELFIKRVTKRIELQKENNTAPVLVSEKIEIKTESSLEDLGLAEVFQG